MILHWYCVHFTLFNYRVRSYSRHKIQPDDKYFNILSQSKLRRGVVARETKLNTNNLMIQAAENRANYSLEQYRGRVQQNIRKPSGAADQGKATCLPWGRIVCSDILSLYPFTLLCSCYSLSLNNNKQLKSPVASSRILEKYVRFVTNV